MKTHLELKALAASRPMLTKYSIKTLLDLDIYRYQHITDSDGIESRYGTMVKLWGQKQADIMMRNLEALSWKL